MDITATLNEIEALSIEDRINLVQATWDGIAEDGACADLRDMQRQELDRRIADSENNPGNVMTWQEILTKRPTIGSN
jgi:putative addiction module component (TIGR02574 family)